MWIIQNGTLIGIPDDVPMPPGSVEVEPPEGFWEAPEAYRIEGETIVKRPAPKGKPSPALTPEDIARLKKALDQGDIG
jgi:hypothetical protein